MPKVYCVSDRAIQIDWPADQSDASALASSVHELAALSQFVRGSAFASDWPEFQCVQADQSLTLLFREPVLPSQLLCFLQTMQSKLVGFSAKATNHVPSRRHHVLAVQYGGSSGPDLEWLASQTGLGVSEVIDLHCSVPYTVQFLGFLPGFAYLSGLPPALHLPRRANPRPHVPAGSLAIGSAYCAVYPWASPGGWHLLGKTVAVLFRPEPASDQSPSLLQVGDTVQFVRKEYA